MNLSKRLLDLERRATQQPPDDLATRSRRIVDLLAIAYRRKHGYTLPDDKRRAWLAELSTAEGMSQFRQEWMETRRDAP